MGHSSLEATEPSEARVWKGEPKSFLGEVNRSEKHGMVFAGLGRMVGLPDESLTARTYSTTAVQTASGSPALNLTAHRASQTIKPHFGRFPRLKAMVRRDPTCPKHPPFERVTRPDSGLIPGLENLRHHSPPARSPHSQKHKPRLQIKPRLELG